MDRFFRFSCNMTRPRVAYNALTKIEFTIVLYFLFFNPANFN